MFRNLVRKPSPADLQVQELLLAFLREPVRFSEDTPLAEPVFLPPNTPQKRANGLPYLEGGIRYKLPEAKSLVIWKGDISDWHIPGRSDAIVAPANKRLTAGVGVNRAIHNAAGPRLADACSMVCNMRRPDIKCIVGEAVMTKAYDLPSRRIIHAVGPAYDARPETPGLLRSAYRKSLHLCGTANLSIIAFPAISCCNFGYPVTEGARVALDAVKTPPDKVRQVHFVLNTPEIFVTWIHEANKIFRAE